MKKIKYNSKVDIKEGDLSGTSGVVTMVANINGSNRYYVTRQDNTVKWYTFHQLRLSK